MHSNFDYETKWKSKRALMLFLGNALPLLLALYGLKCIVSLQGSLTEPSRLMLHTFRLVPVKGMAAAMAGFGDIALALFGYLSSGPTKEGSTWLWRIARGILRWGSLVAAFLLWHKAHMLRLGML